MLKPIINGNCVVRNLTGTLRMVEINPSSATQNTYNLFLFCNYFRFSKQGSYYYVSLIVHLVATPLEDIDISCDYSPHFLFNRKSSESALKQGGQLININNTIKPNGTSEKKICLHRRCSRIKGNSTICSIQRTRAKAMKNRTSQIVLPSKTLLDL